MEDLPELEAPFRTTTDAFPRQTVFGCTGTGKHDTRRSRTGTESIGWRGDHPKVPKVLARTPARGGGPTFEAAGIPVVSTPWPTVVSVNSVPGMLALHVCRSDYCRAALFDFLALPRRELVPTRKALASPKLGVRRRRPSASRLAGAAQLECSLHDGPHEFLTIVYGVH
jgi:hypothetical protein